MKTETRIDSGGRERRLITLQEDDFRTLKQEFLGRNLTVTIWLDAAVFRSGDIVVNERERDKPGCCGRFELLEEIDRKYLKRGGKYNYYQKWSARKFTKRLRRVDI